MPLPLDEDFGNGVGLNLSKTKSYLQGSFLLTSSKSFFRGEIDTSSSSSSSSAELDNARARTSELEETVRNLSSKLESSMDVVRELEKLPSPPPMLVRTLAGQLNQQRIAIKSALQQVEKQGAAGAVREVAAASDIPNLNKQLIDSHLANQGPNVSIFYKEEGGFVATSGSGCIMSGPEGDYLDCANNVAGVGHSHPKVVEAGVKELQNIQTNGRFLHPIRERYVKKLLATLPPSLDVIYLVNSGSEANDLALRMAKQYASLKKCRNPEDIICLDAAYHGHTQSIVDISPYKWRQCTDGKEYHKSHVHICSVPDTYRGPYRGEGVATGRAYAQEISDIVGITGGVGAFIHESIMGCGGQIVMPEGYLPMAYEKVRSAGGLCIADEVQTGFGRAGTNFWAFQEYGVEPDIVTMGKPMGNGYPLAGVAVRREVAEAFSSSGIEYFNTYGGNSVACAIGEAVLDAIEEDGLQENSRVVGEYLKKRMKELKSKSVMVGDVRGFGLFLGIEFIQKPAFGSSEPIPHPDLAKFTVDHLKHNRIITSRDGPDGNVLKIKPPLSFSKENADNLISCIERALVD
eukprot:CAMPEP_0118657704 /NCGR_PEP_ID=MMETSP0785-20121206/14166_1 /TAXON_ID=91992 /ORGANISM="Bolidomonas pacifica, Strain CCMP 1866" /LENGTH=574 /DNA_ID=CAMNT_0006550651 /DNA_START=114 /DNA_END=1835 /DNA_ORIENTATION=+